ncbi:MAG TPA: helix-turn-helix transcriptional regulator [Pyrinomonadaceae bacterium]
MTRILFDLTFDVNDKLIVISTADALTFPVMSKAKPSAVLRREFGNWLQKERESHGLSQKFVADKAKLTVTQLSRIENGQSGTRRDKVILLAKVIGIDVIEALWRFAPESITRLPGELENIPFDELDKQDLREIADFINFKLFQKRQAHEGEAAVRTGEKPPAELKRNYSRKAKNKEEPEIRLEEDLRNVPSYRFKDGQLVTDSNDKEETNAGENMPPKK